MQSKDLKMQIKNLHSELYKMRPLIHCITNPITINDSANALISIGARPIMAEHPDEVSEITAVSKALLCNLGNITDARMDSMQISASEAHKKGIPAVLDAVGAGCSTLRHRYADDFIRRFHPPVIKGNLSEILALCGMENRAVGIDSGDEISLPDESNVGFACDYAKKTSSVVMISGKYDIICSPDKAYCVSNGDRMMSLVTGTGCMLGAVTAAYCAAAVNTDIPDAGYTDKMLYAALAACTVFGIAGEKADKTHGSASFHISLLDSLSLLTDEDILSGAGYRKII